MHALIRDAGGAASVFGMSSERSSPLDAAAQGSAIAKLALYEPPFIVDDTRPPFPDDYGERLAGLLANGRAGRRGRAVHEGGGGRAGRDRRPHAGITVLGGSALEAVAHTLPYDAAITRRLLSGWPLPAGAVDKGHRADARYRRRRQSGVGAQRGAGACGRAAGRATSHAGWADAPGRPGGPRPRAAGALRGPRLMRSRTLRQPAGS